MSWQAAVVTRLMEDLTVFGLVGENIEWDDRAPDAPLPAIMLQTITDDRPQTHDGFDDFRGTRVQINCLARTKNQAAALLEAVIAALAPSAEVGAVTFLRSFVDNGGSDAEQTGSGRICRERTDLIIWHN
ncbi:MAG: tail completion protein gp17 [Rhabdaerophilum sp.]